MDNTTRRIHFDSIDSTNNYVKKLILDANTEGSGNDEIKLPIVVTADQQTAGRGRLGKSFYSPSGSGIYLSFAYEKDYTEEELLGVTTEVANLLLPVMQAHTEDKLYIKPINDIYRGIPGEPDSRKLAGILTERVDYPDRSGRYFLVVGIGINCFETELPEELQNIVGFLEPDCSREQLKEEEISALLKLI